MEDATGGEPIVIRMSDEVAARLDARLILLDDVRAVIAHAEATGRRLVKPADGHVIASYRPAAVTYWVEYEPVGDAYVVHNAYSHRMEIGEPKPNQGTRP